MRIVDADGQDVPDGAAGESWLRGPNVTPGYWQRPDERAPAFTADGWFRTGDVGRRDADGFITIVDRRKDMFISGGENVYPAEIEAALVEHPAVTEAAVIGVPDARWGEVGCAFVVAAAGRDRLRGRARGPLRGAPRPLQGAQVLPPRRGAAPQRHRKGREAAPAGSDARLGRASRVMTGPDNRFRMSAGVDGGVSTRGQGSSH